MGAICLFVALSSILMIWVFAAIGAALHIIDGDDISGGVFWLFGILIPLMCLNVSVLSEVWRLL